MDNGLDGVSQKIGAREKYFLPKGGLIWWYGQCVHRDEHELYLLCDDIEAFVAMMTEHNIACDPVQDRWGLLTRVTLPGGGHIGVYEPRHEHPENAQ